MPMAVSPDKRFLVAAVRSKPYEAYTYAIDKKSGALKLVGKGPLAESYPYITIDAHRPLPARRVLWRPPGGREPDRQGRQGRRADPGDPDRAQRARDPSPTTPTASCSCRISAPTRSSSSCSTRRAASSAANTPPVVQMKQGTGPRHLIVSKDNKFVYLLNELTATVTTLALDAKTGTLKEVDSASALPPDTKLGPGAPRGAGRRARTGSAQHRQRHLGFGPAPHAERPLPLCGRAHVELARRASASMRRAASSPIVGSTPTEKQPRGFAIDPSGRFVVVSGEKSDTISSYAIDAETGALKPIGTLPDRQGRELGRDRLVRFRDWAFGETRAVMRAFSFYATL